MTGGLAGGFAMAESDQATPSPGQPSGTPAGGTSHRWDAGPAGRTEPGSANTSPGDVTTGGAYSGRYPKTYTLSITATGNVGAAVFSWSDTLGGGGSGIVTGVDVPLADGLTVTFDDGDSSPSFVAGDVWQIPVRTDLRRPTTPAMAARLDDERVLCSTCHNQHSQLRAPFDPGAPPYGGSGTGEGRHFQRVDNDQHQMCLDCHAARDVTSIAGGSHPVGVAIPGSGAYQQPASLPLDPASSVVCLTCHQVHYASSDDGALLRDASPAALCRECHTIGDTATPARHLDTSDASTLWPGGEYGSTFPAITDASKAGSCANCHQAHGWPDSADPAQDYPLLGVDFEESLCFTCHDGSPVSGDLWTDFGKESAHPLSLASGVHSSSEPAIVGAARHVECADCHDPHLATGRVDLPGPATSPRPASGPLTGVRGVTITGVEVAPADYEYELCFRCHADSPGLPAPPTTRQFPESNLRLEFNGSFPSYHAVTTAGVNPDVPSLIGDWTTDSIMSCTDCHNNDDGPNAGGTGANGPHGSDWPSLLERRYETANNTPFSTAAYALCFKCHSWSSLSSGTSFDDHDKHVRGEDTPCNVCHDPHASSGSPKLINFDLSVVNPYQSTLEYVSTGRFQGYCTLSCHGKSHNRLSY